MRYLSIVATLIATRATIATTHPSTVPESLLSTLAPTPEQTSNVSLGLFAELEELSRIVDISYCVGTTGISHPFSCASRCDDFPSFELVDTFNTGPLMSDSCGYIALDHSTKRVGRGRIIVAFRGTYSIANTIVDLSTVPQEYVPYPGSPGDDEDPPSEKRGRHRSFLDLVPRPGWLKRKAGSLFGAQEVKEPEPPRCLNCTVHTGFWTSWQNTRELVLPHLTFLREKYPNYRVDLVGHSLGGAVAALAGLEFDALGWQPFVTTFGEPKVGNSGLRNYVDQTFQLPSEHLSSAREGAPMSGRYRRVTHIDDPVPLLPLQEWGYRSHAGEVFISKGSLQPSLSDVRLCYGDEDLDCIASAEVDESWFNPDGDVADIYDSEASIPEFEAEEDLAILQKRWGVPIPARYKIWQLFFAHRDYFWRLGLCVPGGDPLDWGRERYDFGDGNDGDIGKIKPEL